MTTVRSWKQVLDEYLVIASAYENMSDLMFVTQESFINDMAKLIDELFTYPVDEHWLEIPPTVTNATESQPVIHHHHRYICQGGRMIHMLKYSSMAGRQNSSELPVVSENILYPIRQEGARFYIPNPRENAHIYLGDWHCDVLVTDRPRWMVTQTDGETDQHIAPPYQDAIRSGRVLLSGLSSIRELPNGQRLIDKIIADHKVKPIPILTIYSLFDGMVAGYSCGIRPTTYGNGYHVDFVADSEIFLQDEMLALRLSMNNSGIVPMIVVTDGCNQTLIDVTDYDSATPNDVYCYHTKQYIGFIDTVQESNRPNFSALAKMIFIPSQKDMCDETKSCTYLDIHIDKIDGVYYLMNSMLGLKLKNYLEQLNGTN